MSLTVLLKIGQFALLIATVIGCIRFKKLEEVGLKWVPFYLIFSVVIEVVVHLGGDAVRTSAYTVFDIVTYVFFSIYFYVVLDRSKVILALGIIYLVALAFSGILEDVSELLQIQSVVGTLVILAYVMVYFIILLNRDVIVPVLQLPSFWIAIGLLVFNLGYLPITFSLSSEILPSRQIVYTIVAILGTFLYMCYSIAFLCKKEI